MKELTNDGVYSNSQEEWYPGSMWQSLEQLDNDDLPVRERSRPGEASDEQVHDKIQDIYGNQVTNKPANKAILANQRRQQEHNARVKAKQDQRSQKPPSSRLFTIFLFLAFLPLFSSFVTQSYTFNLSPYLLPPLRRFWTESSLNPWRREMKVFSPVQLAMYDGREDMPVYLAIDGMVYDVSANRRIYGKGGSYNMMAGRDASRAFVTGCFETHLTHDIRGLSSNEMASLNHWKSFFANSDKYLKVGTVLNPPINPKTPLPSPCRAIGSDSSNDPQAPGAAAAERGKAKPGPVRGH
nr:hypothetical protein L204_01997 [Cryptococcus depauperatus CBS 7855]